MNKRTNFIKLPEGNKKPKTHKSEPDQSKCNICNQILTDIPCRGNFDKNSTPEFVSITNDSLSLFTGCEQNLTELNSRPVHKLTNYTIYDNEGHLCALDSGLIESGVTLKVSGYIKAIYDDTVINKGIATHDIGPITEWYIAGFDGGENAYVGILSEYSEYILSAPSPEYGTVMEPLQKKVNLLKIILEYLLDNCLQDPAYEDLLVELESQNTSEDFLLYNADFICNQIVSFDNSMPEEIPLVETSCIQMLMHMTGVKISKNGNIKMSRNKSKVKNKFGNITMTKIIESVFKNYFEEPVNTNGKYESNTDNISVEKKMYSTRKIVNRIQWLNEPFSFQDEKKFFFKAVIGKDIEIQTGDFVLLSPDEEGHPFSIGKIQSLFEKDNQATVHVQLFWRGCETILGEVAENRELFASYICEDCPLGSVIKKISVKYIKNLDYPLSEFSTNFEHGPYDFYFNKSYDSITARFTDCQEISETTNTCHLCLHRSHEKDFEKIICNNGSIKWRGEMYKIGSAVFLNPNVYNFTSVEKSSMEHFNPSIDEDKYPEFYRKFCDIKKSDRDEIQPFCIGIIEKISENQHSIKAKIKLRLFIRPEHTQMETSLKYSKELSLLYWTEKVISTTFENVCGKCYLKYFKTDAEEDAALWIKNGPYRFYFCEAYNLKDFSFSPIPNEYINICEHAGNDFNLPKWNAIKRPLRCMDVFVGCGGLSLGLHQAKFAETKWAIDIDKQVADTFKNNNKSCKVYIEDANKILRELTSGNNKKFDLPSKSEVELLVGGAPCQGFSDMNRYKLTENSLFHNSLITTLLGYCDYYRPKYFIMENVQSFVSYQKGMVLKMSLKCLLKMGYQVAVGILQASLLGTPQTRRRLILIAAAPGCPLPKFPEPINVSERRSDFDLAIILDGKRYPKGNLWTETAPYRKLCVVDAISDLSSVFCGEKNESTLSYDGESKSTFQKNMRSTCLIVYDHISKKLAPIVKSRILLVPKVPGSDWRDLPNICVRLEDNSVTKKLIYKYRSKNQNADERPRGVCACATGRNCLKEDRQDNTIIPWCLAHTADRHNNWAGVYGRLEWHKLFKTTTTNPEPMGMQGTVIHPEEDRVVSVRECARSQGFPDEFRFCGDIAVKYRQIGNAVPPPMARAIGIEFINAIVMAENFFEFE